jgi:hypothetical protein
MCGQNIAASDVEREKHGMVVAPLWGSYAKPLSSQGKLQGQIFATLSDCLPPHSFDLDIVYTVSYI